MTDENNKDEQKDFKSLAETLKKSLETEQDTVVNDTSLLPLSDKTKTKQPERLILDAIPIREGVLFPSTESVLTFGRQLSLNTIKDLNSSSKTVVLLTQRNPTVNMPEEKDLYTVGTLAVVERKLKTEESVNALVKGLSRVRVIRFVATTPKLVVEVERITESEDKNEETDALVSHLQKEFRKAVHMGKPVEFLNFMKLMGGVTNGELVDQIASTLSVKTEEKQEILETFSVKERLTLVIKYLAHELKVLEIEKDVVHKTQEKFDKSMRENILRERLRTIQKELGDIDDEEEAADNYQVKLKKLKLPSDLNLKVKKEIKRLRQMSPNNPETGYIRSWLDTVFELPWNSYSKAVLDIKKAQAVLDKNHFGLEEVKDRILEYIAVLSLKQKAAKKEDQSLPTILCFVGPPGVGKTSIGKSIAQALGRKFIKVSLGGIKDESEIRGHRRTYVGAMPGKIINGMKQAKNMNPVFMLDEIDKIGSDYKGDPSAALLEALDPEQNFGFEDHYLDMPFDLSQVIFITTANTLDTIPPALKDRLEIIRYSGYTQEEKFNIGKDYLFEKVLKANGLNKKQISITDSGINEIIERYTREAGVRSLERTLSTLMRKSAKAIITDSKVKAVHITPQLIKEYLGPEKFDVNSTEKNDIVGQATGLAWTSVGGELLFIEVALTPGKGLIKLTGKLGDVMKESAQAAFTYVKANYQSLGIPLSKLQKTDVHVHVPEGAVPKDGPSAGVTMTTAIVSAFTNIPVNKDIAMTGEVTLRGRVLRIGGLKEKSIAAHMAGSKIVLIPKENERDILKIPESVKRDIQFIPMSNVAEVLERALTKKLKPLK